MSAMNESKCIVLDRVSPVVSQNGIQEVMGAAMKERDSRWILILIGIVRYNIRWFLQLRQRPGSIIPKGVIP